MSSKDVELDGIGLVRIIKRRGSRTIRLTFDEKGDVRVSIPYWIPFSSGVAFAKERKEWIIKHRPERGRLFASGDKIGKAHHMTIEGSPVYTTVQVRLKGSEILVKHPSSKAANDPSVQAAAERGAKKALLKEGNRLLPQRLSILAEQHGFRFRSVTVKQLKTKWGSCNQNHEITLNYYLLQLPWNLIDYVLIHELVHTEHLNHSEAFWQRFEQALPGAKKIRKELRTYKTSVIAK